MEQRKLRLSACAAAFGIFILTGCAIHHIDPRPQPLVEPPATFSSVETGPPPPGTPWWETFSDPVLSSLIETALAQNLTLGQAIERVEQGEAFVRQANAVRFPQVGATGGVERRLDRERPNLEGPSLEEQILDTLDTAESVLGTAESLRAGVGLGGGLPSLPEYGADRGWRTSYDTPYSTGLSLSWEADLWGRLRSEAKAQREELAATVQDYEALRLILSSQVAQAYYEAVEQRLQYALLLEQQESTQDYLELLELRFAQGTASAVDMLQQRGQLAGIEAEVPVVQSRLGLLENRLDVLLGQAPDGSPRTENPEASLTMEPDLAPAGVPIDLLQNRPDLAALRRRVVAADYRVAAAIAERLPRVTLDGSLLFGETAAGGALNASAAANLFQPLVDWGLRKAAVTAARSQTRELLLAFTEGYLEAIEEVESALWREARQRELIEALAGREDILEETVRETRVRYSLGVTDYLPVLTAIQDLQEVQREILFRRRELVSLRIELHRAAGGMVPPSDAPNRSIRTQAVLEEG